MNLREQFEKETGSHVFADQKYIEWLEEKLTSTYEVAKLYNEVVDGDKNHMGMDDCLDSYYRGCWDKKLKKIKELKYK